MLSHRDLTSYLSNATIQISLGWKFAAEDQMDSYVNSRGSGYNEPDMPCDILMIPGDYYFDRLIVAYEKSFGPYLGAKLPV